MGCPPRACKNSPPGLPVRCVIENRGASFPRLSSVISPSLPVRTNGGRICSAVGDGLERAGKAVDTPGERARQSGGTRPKTWLQQTFAAKVFFGEKQGDIVVVRAFGRAQSGRQQLAQATRRDFAHKPAARALG